MARSSARKRYNIRMIWLALLYMVALIGATYGFEHDQLNGATAYIAAILPALAIIGMFGAIGRYLVEEGDEYQRMLLVRQILWASAFALSLATTWGFLESFGLTGHVEAFYIAVVWFLGLGLGAIYNRLTLGASVGC
jgi:hypothetical protein